MERLQTYIETFVLDQDLPINVALPSSFFFFFGESRLEGPVLLKRLKINK